MEPPSVDPSALTFTEKKTLFSSISSADHATPPNSRPAHNTSLSLSSFRHQLEHQYPKYLTAPAANKVHLAPAKLFGEATAPGSRAAAFHRLDRQQSHKLILEVATQTESFSPAATVAAQHSNPPDSPDAVALLWLPRTSVQAPAEGNSDQANPVVMKDAVILSGDGTSGRDQSLGSRTPPGLIADLLSQFVADCKEKGVCIDPRVSEALRAAQLFGKDLVTLAAAHSAKSGDIDIDNAATQQKLMTPPKRALSVEQSSCLRSSQDASGAARCTSPSLPYREARIGTTSATSSGVDGGGGVDVAAVTLVRAANHYQVDSFESSRMGSGVTALQEQVRQLRLQLQLSALSRYDANRTLGSALRRSLTQVQEVIASAATATAAPMATSESGTRSASTAPAAAAATVAAAPSDVGLAQQLWMEQLRRTELSGMCSRLQRQCQGLLSYISLLSGNGCVSMMGDVATQPTQPQQQQPERALQCTERVRMRLVLLPARGAWTAWAAGRGGKERGLDRLEGQVDCEESDNDEPDAENVATCELPVRVKVQLVVRRTRALVGLAPWSASEHPSLCRRAAAGLALSPCHILKPPNPQATQHPRNESVCAGVGAGAGAGAGAAATRVIVGMVKSQERISPEGMVVSAADAGPSSGLRNRLTQHHVPGWSGGQHRGHEAQADSGLSAAVRQLVAAVEEQTVTASAAVAAAGSSSSRLAVSPVSQSILDGLRGVLLQLRCNGSEGDAGPCPSAEGGVCAAQPTSPHRNSHAELQLPQLVRQEVLPPGDAAVGPGAALSKRRMTTSAAALAAAAAAAASPPRRTEAAEVVSGDSLREDGVSSVWAWRTKSAPASGFTFADTGGDQIPYDNDSDFYKIASEARLPLEDSHVCGGGGGGGGVNRRMHERVTTPPCSPRTSHCTPFASMDEDDLRAEGSGLGLCSAATATATGGDGSGSGSGCFFDAEYGSRGDWYGDEEFYLDLEDVDELAVAAAVNGPTALLSAVRVLREQLLQAHLEIVKLSTQLLAVSHQREGLRAQASQRDAALQLVAINEGDALLEAERLRAQLASERAARARLSAQYEDLRAMLSLGIHDGAFGAHPQHPCDYHHHSHNHSHHSGSLQRLSHMHLYGHNYNQYHQGCDLQQLQQLLLQHQEHQNQRSTLPPRHRSAPRHRPTGAFSARAACDNGAVVGSQAGPALASVLLSSR
ncbi:hypothetical protein VaNZ11_014740 [Volvox africanus]|uniref:Uncharacterized protein n=1 Tax=Volvox africanus TaxID=51714 RepID=A0ABQ5SK54_9CHLO|nr:hypothetical protein VaNZ11_014740 [Volvox africanus]